MVAPSKSWGEKIGATAGDKDKRTSGGAGTQALAAGSGSRNYGKPGEDKMARAQAARPSGLTSPGKQTEGGQGGQPAGGSATSYEYEPGSVQNFPDANAAAVLDTVAQALPGYGTASSLYKGGKLLSGEDATFGLLGDVLGAQTGPQAGWQRDRGKGASSFNPNDPRGTSDDEREIAGRPLRSKSAALPDDENSDTIDPVNRVTDTYSDVMLKDRRKPITSLKQMMETML